jgi:hypothetical protein
VELLVIVSRLWRARWPLLAGVLAAVAVLVVVSGGKLPKERSAIAWARVMLDTPQSQVIASDPDGADSMSWRASLTAHLLARDEVKARLADRLGVPDHEVIVVDATLAVPEAPASLPKRASDAAAVVGAPYVVTASVPRSSLGIIDLETTGPDTAGAARLAEAAVAELEAQSSAGGRFTSPVISGGGGLMERQAFVVEQVTAVHTKVLEKTVPPVKALGAAFVVLLTWTACVLLAPRFRRRRRPRMAEATT